MLPYSDLPYQNLVLLEHKDEAFFLAIIFLLRHERLICTDLLRNSINIIITSGTY